MEFQLICFTFSLQFNTCACLICVLFVPGGLVYCLLFNDRICSIVIIEICSLNKSISSKDTDESVREWREAHIRGLDDDCIHGQVFIEWDLFQKDNDLKAFFTWWVCAHFKQKVDDWSMWTRVNNHHFPSSLSATWRRINADSICCFEHRWRSNAQPWSLACWSSEVYPLSSFLFFPSRQILNSGQ